MWKRERGEDEDGEWGRDEGRTVSVCALIAHRKSEGSGGERERIIKRNRNE